MRPVSRTHPRRRDDDATRRETTTRRASIRARIHRVAVTYLVSIETTRRKVTTGAARGGVSSRSSHRRAGSEGRRRRGRAAARRVGWVFPRFFVAADSGGGRARSRSVDGARPARKFEERVSCAVGRDRSRHSSVYSLQTRLTPCGRTHGMRRNELPIERSGGAHTEQADVPERLRGSTRNRLGTACASSNLVVCEGYDG